MIRNIACRYSQKDVMIILDQVGLCGTYDFIFVPMCPSKRSNRGYAFVNFRCPEYVDMCRRLVSGQTFGTSETEKRCEVTLAHIQGRDNIGHHMSRKVGKKGDYTPLLMSKDGASCT